MLSKCLTTPIIAIGRAKGITMRIVIINGKLNIYIILSNDMLFL